MSMGMRKLLNVLLVVAGIIAGLSSRQATTLAGVPVSRTITQWRSVRTHSSGPEAELSIILDPTATGNGTSGPTVETRGSSNSGTHVRGVKKVQVDFDGPVTLADGSQLAVTYRITTPGSPATMGEPISTTPASVAMDDADTLNILFADAQIPDMSCTNIVIGAGTFAEAITGDTDCNIRSLNGDVNSSGTVSSADVLSTKNEVQLSSDPHTADKAKFDVNLSGIISSSDFLIIKSRVMTPTNTALYP